MWGYSSFEKAILQQHTSKGRAAFSDENAARFELCAKNGIDQYQQHDHRNTHG
jgi:hypothetical protein